MSNQIQKQPKKNKVADVHSGGMRSEAKKTRVVFKNVLDTPFNIPWPEVTKENNTLVLDMLCDLVKPIKEFHNNQPKKDVSSEKKAKKQKKTIKNDSQIAPNSALATVTIEPSSKTKTTSDPAPPIAGSIILGINAVTRSLERSIQDLATNPPPSAIFLCKGDLVPSHLYSHLGPMIAMLPNVKLFPFLRGSEKQLSEALGMQAVGALAIKAGGDGLRDAEGLVMVLDRLVDPINVSWLPKIIIPAKQSSTKPTESEQAQPKAQVEPESSNITEKKDSVSEMDVDKDSEKWIPTNIKAIKTTMPIVTKVPKSAGVPDDKGQSSGKEKNNKNTNTNKNNNNKNNNSNSNSNTQQQQQQQGKKHPSDNPNQVRGNGKKSKTS